MSATGNIHKIIKFSAVDGPGNRSVVFFQGCNYNCVFCHNPETIAIESSKAKKMSVEEIFNEIGASVNFVRGITVSGGEATLQKAFVTELFQKAKEKGLDTFIDSNGTTDFSLNKKLLNVIDKVMLDVKSMDNKEHMKICGASNTMVLKNMTFLANADKLFEVRTVISPNLLDCEKTVQLAASIIAPFGNIRYKLIRYRPNGVRPEYMKLYKVANAAFMEDMKAIALDSGVTDVVII